MAENLGEFLERAGRRGLVYGLNDCMMMPANWLWSLTGIDPAAEWRGRYSDRDGAARIIARAGGLQSLMSAAALSAGAVPVPADQAPPGAVGLVVSITDDGPAPVGAVRTPTGWAVIAADGLAVSFFPVLAAWAVI